MRNVRLRLKKTELVRHITKLISLEVPLEFDYSLWLRNVCVGYV